MLYIQSAVAKRLHFFIVKKNKENPHLDGVGLLIFLSIFLLHRNQIELRYFFLEC